MSTWTYENLNAAQQPRQSSEGEPYGPFVLARLGNTQLSAPIAEQPVAVAQVAAPVPTSPTSKAIEPEMKTIPAGTFTMGCVDGRDNVEGVDKCSDDETPSHEVSISAFQLAATDVTFDQWDACEAAKACPHADDKGWGRGNRPVINVSWNDAKTYIQWLNQESGKSYRLPTEAEWEYAARAGTSTAYSWGGSIGKNKANCAGCGSQWDNKQTSLVRSFAANPFGLYDMNGNVYQWVEDCYVDSYEGALADGTARQGCGANASRVLRGGSWSHGPWGLRAAFRYDDTPVNRNNNVGFRAARTF